MVRVTGRTVVQLSIANILRRLALQAVSKDAPPEGKF
jgi:hypothetical protein